jgi:hypothetical protein
MITKKNDVERHQGQKRIGNITSSTRVKNVLYFFKLRSLGSMVGRTIGNIRKAQKQLFLHNKE